jgi:hypothetical protein
MEGIYDVWQQDGLRWYDTYKVSGRQVQEFKKY